MKICFIFLVVVGACDRSNSQSWSYSDQEAWKIDFPACRRDSQSPIGINARETITRKYPPIMFKNYNQILDVRITNTGQTAQINYPDSSKKPQISGGPLQNGTRYELANIHFHWGANNSVGAEHIIDRRVNSMEVHIVHYNLKYGNLQNAIQFNDGLAVVAMFYRVSPCKSLDGLWPISNALSRIIRSGSQTIVKNFHLNDILGGLNQTTFFTYEGFLTAPPCSEAVTWIIYPEPLSVQAKQLQPFRDLKDNNGLPLSETFRQTQKRNGRMLYRGRSSIQKS